MQSAKKVVGITLAAAVICAALAFAIPMPASWPDSSALYYGLLSLTFCFVVLHIGAVALFFMALGAYKEQLRRAFFIICTSIMLLALGLLQLPVISALNFWASAWVTHGGIGTPFLLAEITAYFGVRSLAKLIGLKSVLMKPLIVLPVLAAVNALTALLPHVKTATPENAYDLSVAVLSWGAMLYFATAALAFLLYRHIGAHYKNAVAWLFLALLETAIAMTLAMLATLLSSRNQDGWSVATDIVALLTGLTYLRAALVFFKTKEY
jgi:hypothetical protein